jgi:hypothetical protein
MINASALDIFIQFVPLLLLSVILGVVAHLLAKQKGRNVFLWTVLGALPLVNFISIWFFVGAANLRLERKIDELLQRSRVSQL